MQAAWVRTSGRDHQVLCGPGQEEHSLRFREVAGGKGPQDWALCSSSLSLSTQQLPISSGRWESLAKRGAYRGSLTFVFRSSPERVSS